MQQTFWQYRVSKDFTEHNLSKPGDTILLKILNNSELDVNQTVGFKSIKIK